MTVETPRVGASAPGTSQPKVNTLSIVSIVLVAVAVAGSVFGGAVVLAVFAVGAGHVALQQIATRGERGATLAYIALVLSYGMAIYAVITLAYLAVR